MKKFALLFFSVQLFSFVYSQSLPSIHSLTANTIDGELIGLNKFSGKKIMIVNTASFCGYTSQFATLQLLYKNFNRYNFEIIGFPSNDFGGQDPNNDSTIHVFCSANYGVTFQMMSKIHVKTGDTSQVYRWLQQANLNGVKNNTVTWNFNKFLINESGNFVKHYTEITEPNDTAIVKWIVSESSIKTGIDENKNLENVAELVSPMPCNNLLEFKIQSNTINKITYSIYNISGGLIINNYAIMDIQNKKSSIDVSNLQNGIYFLKIEGDFNSEIRKFIVNR